jgi:hypothetical protein
MGGSLVVIWATPRPCTRAYRCRSAKTSLRLRHVYFTLPTTSPSLSLALLTRKMRYNHNMPGGNKKIRERLFKKDPHCQQCGVLTVSPRFCEGMIPPPNDMATLEHIYSRFHPIRHSQDYAKFERYKILCYQCNHANARAEQEYMSAPLNLTKRKKRKYMEREGFARGARVRMETGPMDNYGVKEALTRAGFGDCST